MRLRAGALRLVEPEGLCQGRGSMLNRNPAKGPSHEIHKWNCELPKKLGRRREKVEIQQAHKPTGKGIL